MRDGDGFHLCVLCVPHGVLCVEVFINSEAAEIPQRSLNFLSLITHHS